MSAVSPAACLGVLIWMLISVYLLVDTFSGMLMADGAAQAPLSQAWKILIIVLILVWMLATAPRLAAFCAALILWILLGPLLRLFASGNAAAFMIDATAGIKAILPLIVLSFCNQQQLGELSTLARWAWRALWISSAVVFANIVLGLVGFGYPTYDYSSSGSPDVGVKGFFYAGNEISATYVILSAFVLMEVWNRRRGWYIPVALLVVGAAFALATKSAIIGSILLALGMPVAYLRGRLLSASWKGAVAAALALALLAWGMARLWLILEVAGLADRIAGILARQGWMGVVFSGRDQFAAATLRALSEHGTLLESLFGFGQHGLLLWSGKQGTEIDPLDLYLWFGVPGVLYGMVLYVACLYLSIRGFGDRSNDAAPAVLLTNLIVILISITSGHVVLAGMVGIAWAAFNATVLVAAREPAAGRFHPALQRRYT